MNNEIIEFLTNKSRDSIKRNSISRNDFDKIIIKLDLMKYRHTNKPFNYKRSTLGIFTTISFNPREFVEIKPNGHGYSANDKYTIYFLDGLCLFSFTQGNGWIGQGQQAYQTYFEDLYNSSNLIQYMQKNLDLTHYLDVKAVSMKKYLKTLNINDIHELSR